VSFAAGNLLPSISTMRLLKLTVLLVLALPSPHAFAQVYYDNGDSAGKEYAIPDDDARRGASGNKNAHAAGDKPALFGEGVSGSNSSGSPSSDPSGKTHDKNGKGSGDNDGGDDSNSQVPGAAGGGPTDPGAGENASATQHDGDGGTSGALWSLLFVGAVLLIGTGIAFAVRRSRRMPDPEPSR
jgi:hypothetical protein